MRTLSLNAFMTRLIWFCVLPLMFLAGYLAINHVQTLEEQRDRDAADRARNIATGIDRYLKAQIAALQMLAASPLVDDPSRLGEFYAEALGFRESFGGHIVFADLSTQMIFNTRVPLGTALPKLPVPKGHAAAPAALATGKPAVGDVFLGPVAKEPLVAVVVPVIREDRMKNLLVSSIETRRFHEQLDEVALPAGWSLTLFDGEKERIARRSPPGMEEHPADAESPGRFIAKSTVAPWSVVLEVPPSVYRTPIIKAAVAWTLAILAFTLMSVLGGRLAGRRLARSVAALAGSSPSHASRPVIAEIEAVRKVMADAASAREVAELTLRESELRFRQLFDVAPVPLCFVNRDGTLMNVNARFQQVFGYSHDELPTLSEWRQLAYPDPEYRHWVVETWEAALRRAREEETGIEPIEYRVTCKDGRVLTIVISGTILGDDFLVTFFDITKRKQAEEKVRASEERLRLALLAANAGIWEWDLETGENFWSEELWSLYGIEPHSCEPSYDAWCGTIHPDDRERTEQTALEASRSGTELHAEWRVRGPDGGERWLMSRGRPLFDPYGKPTRYRGVVIDITERKRAEEEKGKLKAQLFRTQQIEAIGRLAGGVAHDFNNMLGVIVGHAELALDETDPEQPQYLDLLEIQKAARRSAELTRQLLAFARKQTASPKILDLNETVSGMISMLRRLIGEDIELAWLPAPDLWKVRIDPSQIDQIMANLAVNARDAIDGVGKVTIETRNIELDGSYGDGLPDFVPGKYVLLTVSDNGAGMSREVREHVFEPFFTTKEVGRGTGLGLATVYGIVRQNDGFINVYSEPGDGTTFKIYLPVFEGESARRRPEPMTARPFGGTETVLLVEDEEAILKLGKTMLERLGYRVMTANRPSEAINIAQKYDGDIHLLITDVVMPEMNGRELAEAIVPIKPGLKCLFMSGYTANAIAHRSVLDEGVGFMPWSGCGTSSKLALLFSGSNMPARWGRSKPSCGICRWRRSSKHSGLTPTTRRFPPLQSISISTQSCWRPAWFPTDF